MKAYFQFLVLFFAPLTLAVAQLSYRDSLKYELTIARDDTSKVQLYQALTRLYMFSKPDSSLFYGYQGIAVAKKINFKEHEFLFIGDMVTAYYTLGNNSKALQFNLRAIKIAEENNFLSEKAKLIMRLARIYFASKNFEKALHLFKESIIPELWNTG